MSGRGGGSNTGSTVIIKNFPKIVFLMAEKIVSNFTNYQIFLMKKLILKIYRQFLSLFFLLLKFIYYTTSRKLTW